MRLPELGMIDLVPEGYQKLLELDPSLQQVAEDVIASTWKRRDER